MPNIKFRTESRTSVLEKSTLGERKSRTWNLVLGIWSLFLSSSRAVKGQSEPHAAARLHIEESLSKPPCPAPGPTIDPANAAKLALLLGTHGEFSSRFGVEKQLTLAACR
jgi:hypothetical protein